MRWQVVLAKCLIEHFERGRLVRRFGVCGVGPCSRRAKLNILREASGDMYAPGLIHDNRPIRLFSSRAMSRMVRVSPCVWLSMRTSLSCPSSWTIQSGIGVAGASMAQVQRQARARTKARWRVQAQV